MFANIHNGGIKAHIKPNIVRFHNIRYPQILATRYFSQIEVPKQVPYSTYYWIRKSKHKKHVHKKYVFIWSQTRNRNNALNAIASAGTQMKNNSKSNIGIEKKWVDMLEKQKLLPGQHNPASYVFVCLRAEICVYVFIIKCPACCITDRSRWKIWWIVTLLGEMSRR